MQQIGLFLRQYINAVKNVASTGEGKPKKKQKTESETFHTWKRNKQKQTNKQTYKRQKHVLNIYRAQLLNRNFTRLGSRLYSPNLKDVARLEDTQLIFDFPFICLQFFSPWTASNQPNLQTNVNGKLSERLLAKLHPSNLVNTIFYQVF